MLKRYTELPEGLLECEAHQLSTITGGPSLISLEGRRPEAVFVSVLLHGNETTGWLAIREILRKYQASGLPRSLELFIGNVDAAAKNRRVLSGQLDYNRAWPGTEHPHAPEASMMEEIVRHLHHRMVFASIDVHNNTGTNPHYGCVNQQDPRFYQLARLFSRTVVYFTKPLGVQSMALSKLCPAVTVECGKVGAEGGVEHAAQFIDAVLNLSEWPTGVPDDISLYHTTAVIKVRDHIKLGFDADTALDLCLRNDLERLNFSDLPAGTRLATTSHQAPLYVVSETGDDVTDDYLHFDGERLHTKVPFMPSMLTQDVRVIKQDCLGYVMERLEV